MITADILEFNSDISFVHFVLTILCPVLQDCKNTEFLHIFLLHAPTQPPEVLILHILRLFMPCGPFEDYKPL